MVVSCKLYEITEQSAQRVGLLGSASEEAMNQHAAGRHDERLHRSEREGREGGASVRRTGGIRAGGDVRMLEQGMVGNAGVGG